MGRAFSKLSISTKTAGDPRVPQELVNDILDGPSVVFSGCDHGFIHRIATSSTSSSSPQQT